VKGQYKVIVDPRWGYRRLDPLPTAEELDRFYREQYYDLLAASGRAPELRRLMQGGEEAQLELLWLSKTTWRDIRDVLDQHMSHKQERWLLDVGCGPGHFGQYMQEGGWHVVGIEPSTDAAEIARSFGILVYDSVEQCLDQAKRRFDAVTFLNVLEHVLDPANLLERIRLLMEKESILVCRVPNDFSAIQECAADKLGLEPWWIAIPDHINYFNFESLVRFLEQLNFEVVEMFGDFPMEMFLLFGDVYVGNPEVGSQCHKKRVAFELSLPVEVRRNLYRCFAKNGLGRDCLVFARPASSEHL
jgi:2-polyprenyl-3-methyl-5-hydroxy-6-metoxy-1,4-benzoquinol methylase